MIKNKKVLLFVGAILLIGIVAYFGVLQSTYSSSNIILAGNSISPITGSLEFSGVAGTYETTWLGSISSGQTLNPESFGITNAGNSQKVIVGSSNDDGDGSLSNSYNINGNVLTLTSSTSTPDSCNLNSYIKVTLNLSKGTVNVLCTDSQSSRYGGVMNYACGIDGLRELKALRTQGTPDGVQFTESQNFTVNVDGITTFYVASYSDCKESETTQASFTYNPSRVFYTMSETTPDVSTVSSNAIVKEQFTITFAGWITIIIILGLIIWITYSKIRRKR